MDKIRILNRQGIFEYIEWDFDPEKNPDAKKRAMEKLNASGMINYEIWEVAPLCFWFRTSAEEFNCSEY